MKSILVIDDDLDYRETIQAWLEEAGYDVQVAESTDQAFTILSRDSFDLILCDLHLPFTLDQRHFDYGYSYTVGVSTIQELKNVYPELPIVAISATMPWDLPKVLKELPELPRLSKPFSRDQLVVLVTKSLQEGSASTSEM